MGSSQVWAAQRRELGRVFGSVIPRDRPFALVDFPDHGNVGDSAIWLGEEHALQSVGLASPEYVASPAEYREEALRRAVGPDGTILIHGGGNLGDLWPRHQEFREHLLASFPGNPIIQLPQSICFQSAPALERSRRVFGAHRRFTLLVRDSESLALAREAFSIPVHLCPDAAFGLDALPPTPAPRQDVLWLSRIDHERAGPLPSPEARGLEPVDWAHDPVARRAGIRQRLVRMLGNERWAGRLALPLRRRRYLALATGRMARGCRLLASARTVVANRLHVHILCVMLGIPHFLSDTAHGKIGAYVRTWTAGWPGVHLYASEQEALTAALARTA